MQDALGSMSSSYSPNAAATPGASAVGPEGHGSARRPEILCLTSLRFVAALEVVLFHTLFELGGKSAEALPRVAVALLTQGAAAVSFFFVLSGFILAYTYTDDRGLMKGTPRRFWRARFARIYPLYALAFVVDAPRVVSFFLASTTSHGAALAKIGLAGLAYLTLLQSWHPRVTNTWNTPGWTLSTEAFFYAAFPALHRLFWRWSFRRLFVAVVATWAVPVLAYVVVIRFRLVDADLPSFKTFWRSFPPLRLPEFALGIVAGRLLLNRGLVGRETAVRWSAVAAAALLVWLSACPGIVPGPLETSVFAPLFALVIFALASGALPTFSGLNGSLPVLLGRASYAVYIIHQPFKTLFMAGARYLGVATPSPALLLAFLVSLELVCIGLFRWFEDPMRRLITKSPTRAVSV